MRDLGFETFFSGRGEIEYSTVDNAHPRDVHESLSDDVIASSFSIKKEHAVGGSRMETSRLRCLPVGEHRVRYFFPALERSRPRRKKRWDECHGVSSGKFPARQVLQWLTLTMTATSFFFSRACLSEMPGPVEMQLSTSLCLGHVSGKDGA